MSQRFGQFIRILQKYHEDLPRVYVPKEQLQRRRRLIVILNFGNDLTDVKEGGTRGRTLIARQKIPQC
jgi:phytoene/squalene synthetase